MTIHCKNCRQSTPTVFVYWIPLPRIGEYAAYCPECHHNLESKKEDR